MLLSTIISNLHIPLQIETSLGQLKYFQSSASSTLYNYKYLTICSRFIFNNIVHSNLDSEQF